MPSAHQQTLQSGKPCQIDSSMQHEQTCHNSRLATQPPNKLSVLSQCTYMTVPDWRCTHWRCIITCCHSQYTFLLYHIWVPHAALFHSSPIETPETPERFVQGCKVCKTIKGSPVVDLPQIGLQQCLYPPPQVRHDEAQCQIVACASSWHPAHQSSSGR